MNSEFPPLESLGSLTVSERSRPIPRCGSGTCTRPEFWLNLQKLYELRLARDEIGERVQKLPKLTERKRS
ncbi:MAG TPA: hypothetical protein VGU64_05000, partial [Terriglobales bacterium]|nr:hypothetical protein [Terriglobales bacterium]